MTMKPIMAEVSVRVSESGGRMRSGGMGLAVSSHLESVLPW